MADQVTIAKVYVEKAAYHFDKPFDYLVPEQLSATLQRGCRVVVPFGNGNRRRQGLVDGIDTVPAPEKALKPVLLQIDTEPVFSEEMFRLARFMVINTFCTFYDAVKTILPNGLNMNLSQEYRLTRIPEEDELSGFTFEERNLIAFLRKEKTDRELDEYLALQKSTGKHKLVDGLIAKGIVAVSDSAKQKVSDKNIALLRLSDEYLNGDWEGKLTPKQKEVVTFLEQNITADKKEVMYFCGVGEGVLRTLVQRQVCTYVQKMVYRIPDAGDGKAESLEQIALSPAQQEVFDGISALLREHKAQVALLHGVTGSGKTQVFIKLIEQVIKNGEQALMLVPEISLTPQMVDRFKALFGEQVAVMHSSLSLGERLDEFKRIRDGKASIVVGTRSAVFAPFQKIGIIIMDEEGEPSYKSEAAPRYHTREIAKFRCVEHQALLLLASATPSVESRYKAQEGVYRYFELKERYADADLPEVFLVDMKEEERQANVASLSGMLQKEIRKNLERGEQTILFINRRGYQTAMQCIDCGEAVKCPHCDAALTYHRDNGYMMCHYCGHSARPPKECPSCGGQHLKLTGLGTQKLQEELESLFPQARVLRMDTDTTYSRYAYGENFEAFGRREYDILLGTQMIAKGLDFPNVTLVGVLNADAGLYAPDYRSAERVFSLITQVVGRSGRAQKSGRAYIQTYLPEHPVISFAAQQDYESFFGDEIAARKILRYPPFCDVCTVSFSGTDPNAVAAAAKQFLRIMRRQAEGYTGKLSFQALGPMKAAMYKMGGKYREKIVIKCRCTSAFKQYLRHCLFAVSREKSFRRITVYADVNGDINS